MNRKKRVLIFIPGFGAFAIACLLALFAAWTHDLPSATDIRQQLYQRYPPAPNTVWIPLWSISPKLRQAIITWEDPAFYHHRGISYKAIWRSLLIDIETWSLRRGGSTITQQLAKNLFLTKEKNWRRKFREAILAIRIESVLTKQQILELYLNIAQLGPEIAGVEAASRSYFAKPARDLDWAESAILAGILPNPSVYNPVDHPGAALQQAEKVLRKLAKLRILSDDEAEIARHQLPAIIKAGSGANH